MRRLRRLLMAGVLAVLTAPSQARSQALVRLTGEMEMSAGYDLVRTGGDTAARTFEWGGAAAPNLDGWIWSPRFLTFSLSGAYRKDQATYLNGDIGVTQWEPYRLTATAFSEAKHTFELRASRTQIDRTFSIDSSPLTTALEETRQEEALTWRFRGAARAPVTSVEIRRERISDSTPDGLFTQDLLTLEVRARQTFSRNQPQLGYTLQHLSVGGTPPSFESPLFTTGGFRHTFQYDDQIRVLAGALLTPSLSYQIASDGSQNAIASATLATRFSPTLEGSTTARYSFTKVPGTPSAHILTTDSLLTKRVSPALTFTLGTNSAAINADTFTWAQGVFGGLSATPWTALQATADFGAQVAGGDEGFGQNYRAHVGAVSTRVPHLTVGTDYYVNWAEAPQDRQQFLSQTASLTASTDVVPFTTVGAGYSLSLQSGRSGDQQRHAASASAAVTPVPFVTLRAAADAYLQNTTGGGRPPIDDVGYGVEAGLSVAPAPWLAVSAFGRHAAQNVDQGGQRTEFITDAARGNVTLTIGNLQANAEAFLDRQPAVEMSRWGVRGSLVYRFRAWSFGIDAEHSRFTTAGVDSTRERFMFRITRAVNGLWRF